MSLKRFLTCHFCVTITTRVSLTLAFFIEIEIEHSTTL